MGQKTEQDRVRIIEGRMREMLSADFYETPESKILQVDHEIRTSLLSLVINRRREFLDEALEKIDGLRQSIVDYEKRLDLEEAPASSPNEVFRKP